MERQALLERIAEDIFFNTDFDKLLPTLKEYRDLLDDTVRNVYEVYWDVPLFRLEEYLRLGKDNYCLTEEEYVTEIGETVSKINELYCADFEVKDFYESVPVELDKTRSTRLLDLFAVYNAEDLEDLLEKVNSDLSFLKEIEEANSTRQDKREITRHLQASRVGR